MPKRTINKHLPPNVHLKSGTYYYVYYEEGKRKWRNIGKTLAEAIDNWVKLVEPNTNPLTMAQLFDRYMVEIAPKKSKESFRTNRSEITHLYKVFGHMAPNSITPVHVYKYLDVRGKDAPVRANREKSLLSHIFSTAIRWGIVIDNPCRNVKRLTEKKRDRYVTDAEFQAIYDIASESMQNIMQFAFLTGLRQLDILKIKLSDLRKDGIFIKISKTKNKIIIEWSPALTTVIDKAKLYGEQFSSEYLFVTKRGKPYTSSGFQTIWQKLMSKGLTNNIIEEKFRFHDIRRKSATEVEQADGRETARKLLGHQDQKTTGTYISGAQKVKPVK